MSSRSNEPGFAKVDTTPNPQVFASYLGLVGDQPYVKEYKNQSFDLLEVGESSRLLDVGCGTGEDVRALAGRVGNSGKVVGIDNSEIMIAQAKRFSAGLGPRVEFVVGSGHSLGFANNSFDGCRADRVFQHLEAPEKTLSEMIRVARPGARLVAIDPDWETLVVEGSDRSLTRKILNYNCDDPGFVRNGWMGRRLPALFKLVGLKEIGVEASTILLTDSGMADKLLGIKGAAARAFESGVVSYEEVVRWLEDLKKANQAGLFFCALTGFAVYGRKP
jgi:SAM-dependent methyltransferase